MTFDLAPYLGGVVTFLVSVYAYRRSASAVQRSEEIRAKEERAEALVRYALDMEDKIVSTTALLGSATPEPIMYDQSRYNVAVLKISDEMKYGTDVVEMHKGRHTHTLEEVFGPDGEHLTTFCTTCDHVTYRYEEMKA